MRQSIVIHSGAYKTATSAVQTALFANQQQLLSEQDLLVPTTCSSRLAGVPDPNASSHNGLGHLVAASQSGVEGAEDRLRESLAALATEVRESGAKRAVVSSELLTNVRAREAALIRDVLAEFDLRVVYSVRRVDDYLESVALQTLKLEMVLNRREPPYATPFGGLLRWADVLGDDALTVLVYGFPSRTRAVVQTLEALGVDQPEQIIRENPIHNPSLRADGYVLQRLLSQLATSATERPLHRPLTEAIIAKAYAFDASRANPKPLVAYSAAERNRMLEDTREVHADIGARFLSPDACAAFLGADDRNESVEDDRVPTWTADEVAGLADEVVGFLRAQAEVLAALGVDDAVLVEARRAAKRAAQRESRLQEEQGAERSARSGTRAEPATAPNADRPRQVTTPETPLFCALCTRKVRAWDPDPRFGTRGVCPHCGSLPRNRLLAVVLQRLEPVVASARTVVEVGPAPDVTRHLVNLVGHHRYIGLDLGLDARNVDVLTDLRRLPVADDSVDVMVVFHILEHIPDDASAMAEIARVIGTHGIAVIQVPWRRNRPTYEDPSAPAEERIERFGQNDHVRYYGSDFVDRLKAAGLQVAEVAVDRDLDAAVVEAGDLRGRLWLVTGEPTDPSDWVGMIDAVVERRGDRPRLPIVVDPRRKIRELEHEVAKLRKRLVNEHVQARRDAVESGDAGQHPHKDRERDARYEQALAEFCALATRRAAELETSARKLEAAYNSWSYRVGHAVLTPWRIAKRAVRGIKAHRSRP